MMIVYIILVGCVLASFIGTLSYRIPRGISIISPSSFCPHCKKRIAPFDLIPVISYILLKGKCRYCSGKIPVRYLVLEVILPASFVLLYVRMGAGYLFLVYSYMFCVLYYLSLLDIDTGLLGFLDIASLYIASGGFWFLVMKNYTGYPPSHYFFGVLTGVVIFVMSFGVVYAIKRKLPMGAGDLLVIPAICSFFGFKEVIRILLISGTLGVFFGTLLLLTGVVKREHKFPLLPYLSAGVFIEVLLIY